MLLQVFLTILMLKIFDSSAFCSPNNGATPCSNPLGEKPSQVSTNFGGRSERKTLLLFSNKFLTLTLKSADEKDAGPKICELCCFAGAPFCFELSQSLARVWQEKSPSTSICTDFWGKFLCFDCYIAFWQQWFEKKGKKRN